MMVTILIVPGVKVIQDASPFFRHGADPPPPFQNHLSLWMYSFLLSGQGCQYRIPSPLDIYFPPARSQVDSHKKFLIISEACSEGKQSGFIVRRGTSRMVVT